MEGQLSPLPTVTFAALVLADWNGFGRGITDLTVAAFSHLGWPAVIVTLALTFRSSVRELLDRIELASWKDAKLTLGRRRLLDKLAQAEAMADALSLPPAIVPGRRVADGVEQAIKDCLKTASKQPARAIVDGW